MTNRIRRALFLVPLFLVPSLARAQATIDFETVPGGTPSDQLAIGAQYATSHGVTFSLQGGGTPYLEATGAGDSGHGFYNWAFSTYDVESPPYSGRLGGYFLRFGTTTFSPTPGPVLVIDYATPVKAASAEVWDIDAATGGTNGYEAWTVTARDAGGNAIDSITSPNGIDESDPSALNGKPWTWSFSHATADIHSITLQFSGTASVVGLAFDNFSPSSPKASAVPVSPWGAILAGLFMVALVFRLQHRARSRGY